MKFMDYETINYNLYSGQDFNVSLLILPNRKQATSGNLMTSAYSRQYDSSKYSNRANLSSITYSFQTYIQFEYLRFVDKNRISESVLVSFPHLNNLANWLTRASDVITSNYETIYSDYENGTIPNEYNQFIISEGMVKGKELAVAPAIVQREYEDQVMNEPGVYFMIKDDNYLTKMSLNAFLGLTEELLGLCNSFNLRNFANQVYIMAQTDHLTENLGASSAGTLNSRPNDLPNRPQMSRTSMPQRPSRGLTPRTPSAPSRPSIPTSSSSSGLGDITGERSVKFPTRPKMDKVEHTVEIVEEELPKASGHSLLDDLESRAANVELPDFSEDISEESFNF